MSWPVSCVCQLPFCVVLVQAVSTAQSKTLNPGAHTVLLAVLHV